jgi:hypothetical protein
MRRFYATLLLCLVCAGFGYCIGRVIGHASAMNGSANRGALENMSRLLDQERQRAEAIRGEAVMPARPVDPDR